MRILIENDNIEWLPADTTAEKIQNIRALSGTHKNSVPFNNAMGTDGDLEDKPLAFVIPSLRQFYHEQIPTYISDVDVHEIDFGNVTQDDLVEGTLRPVMTITEKEEI